MICLIAIESTLPSLKSISYTPAYIGDGDNKNLVKVPDFDPAIRNL